jgi:hypothetical protein
MGKFLLIQLSLSFIILLLGWWMSFLGYWEWHLMDLGLLLFFFLLTLLVHFINLGAVRESGQASVLMILLSMVIRLLLGGAFLLFLIYLYPIRTKIIVAEFFILYTLFTTIEILFVKKEIPS